MANVHICAAALCGNREIFIQEAAVTVINGWENFYIIVGSSAGALTGLMFVVITLIAGAPGRRTSGEVSAYGTPNVVHFCAVLLICSVLSAPWESLTVVGLLLVLSGLSGVLYATIIVRRMIRRARLANTYTPVLEDWVWFGVLPLTAYTAFMIAALVFLYDASPALYIIATALLLLLVIGIHNAWDTVTYITLEYTPPPDDKDSDKV